MGTIPVINEKTAQAKNLHRGYIQHGYYNNPTHRRELTPHLYPQTQMGENTGDDKSAISDKEKLVRQI